MSKQYPCCDDPACSFCHGSGIAEGPEVDAFHASLKASLKLLRVYDAPQDNCPKCGSGSYECWPFGAAFVVECAGCHARWIEPQD